MWYGQSLLPGSISDMVAPSSSPPIRSPTTVPLQRQPSRSLVASHSELLTLKIFTRPTLTCVSVAQESQSPALPRMDQNGLSTVPGQLLDAAVAPGSPARTLGTYSSSCSRPSKTQLDTMSRATSGYPS